MWLKRCTKRWGLKEENGGWSEHIAMNGQACSRWAGHRERPCLGASIFKGDTGLNTTSEKDWKDMDLDWLWISE